MNLQKLQRKAIHRRCGCGCGRIVNLGRKYIWGHNVIGNTNLLGYKHTKEAKQKISLAKQNMSEETKRRMSLAQQNMSEETKLKMSLSHFKYDPNYQYCDSWKDREYRKDLRKNHCKNVDCRGVYKQLGNHHINLNKHDCRPKNTMTLCNSCHISLHHKLESIAGMRGANHEDYLTVNRANRITYVLKGTRKTWILRRVIK